MNKGLAFICIVSLVLGFQNCAPNGLQGLSGTTVDGELITLPPDVLSPTESQSLGSVSYVEVPTFYKDASSVNINSIATNRFVISMQTGNVQLMDSKNAVLDRKCVSSDSLGRLKKILANASLCKTHTSDVMCAQSYTQGYAALVINQERIQLGEMRDACGNGSRDLCGDAAQSLKAYAKSLQSELTMAGCVVVN